MKIRLSGLMGSQHSWSHTTRSFAQEFYKMKHKIYLDPTDGDEYIDKKLKNCIGRKCAQPDFDLTYTLPSNYEKRFLKTSKIKASIFNYESSILPDVWNDKDRHLDKIFASSNYCKEIFLNSGWNPKKISVVPLGVDFDYFNSAKKLEGYDDKFNFLNVSIPHYRKHLDVMIEAYYSAFEGNDDVRLILKTSMKFPNKVNAFELYVPKMINDIQRKLKLNKYPSLVVVNENYENLGSLYKAADCLVSTTGSEGFGLPMLEAMSCGTLVAATNVTGQKDFLTSDNSILIPGYEYGADKRFQYWKATDGAKIFRPKVDEVVDILKNIYENKESIAANTCQNAIETAKAFSWESSAKKMLEEIRS